MDRTFLGDVNLELALAINGSDNANRLEPETVCLELGRLCAFGPPRRILDLPSSEHCFVNKQNLFFRLHVADHGRIHHLLLLVNASLLLCRLIQTHHSLANLNVVLLVDFAKAVRGNCQTRPQLFKLLAANFNAQQCLLLQLLWTCDGIQLFFGEN